MIPIERIGLIIKHYNMNISNFEKSVGLSNNTIGAALRRKTTVKDETLNSILNVYEDINPTWLLTGRGEMLISSMNGNEEKNIKKNLSDYSDFEIVEYIAANLDRFKGLSAFRVVVGIERLNEIEEKLTHLEKKIADS